MTSDIQLAFDYSYLRSRQKELLLQLWGGYVVKGICQIHFRSFREM